MYINLKNVMYKYPRLYAMNVYLGVCIAERRDGQARRLIDRNKDRAGVAAAAHGCMYILTRNPYNA